MNLRRLFLLICIAVLIVIQTNAQCDNQSPCDTLQYGVTTPVELESSRLTIEDDQPIIIWTTASERNNDYFTILRSTDGVQYNIIGQIKGHGTSMVQQYYQFKDTDNISGRLYYKLYQTDFDGTSEQLVLHTINLDWKYVDGFKVLGNIIGVKYYDLNGRDVNKDDPTIKVLAVITDEGMFLTLRQ